jgi:hypothetical protein
MATAMQRYAMLQHTLRPYTMTITHAINTALVLMCLIIGGPLIATSNTNDLKWLIGIVAFGRALSVVEDIMCLAAGSFLKARVMVATGVWMGHHFSRDTLLTILPRRLGGLRLGFRVSGVDDEIVVKERDPENRPSLLVRLWKIHQAEGILWHMVLFVFTLALVNYRVQSEIETATVDGKLVMNNEFWKRLIQSVGFPGLSLIETAPLYLTPIIYVMFPPTIPARRNLMEIDEKTKLWKPSPKHKEVIHTKAS